MGCKIGGGGTVIVGEMNVAWGETDLPRVPPSAQGNWVAPHQPAVATTPGKRLGVGHIPGGQHSPGPDYIGRSGMGTNLGEDRLGFSSTV